MNFFNALQTDGKTFEFDMTGKEDFDAVMGYIGGAKWKKNAGIRINPQPHLHSSLGEDNNQKDVEVTLNPPPYENLDSMDASAPYEEKIV